MAAIDDIHVSVNDLSINSLALNVTEWSRKTFGEPETRGPIGSLKHLAKEIQEVIDKPTDVTEYADCLILLIDASFRAGIGINQLIGAATDKMIVNRARQWPAPTPDAPVEHIKLSLAHVDSEWCLCDQCKGILQYNIDIDMRDESIKADEVATKPIHKGNWKMHKGVKVCTYTGDTYSECVCPKCTENDS